MRTTMAVERGSLVDQITSIRVKVSSAEARYLSALDQSRVTHLPPDLYNPRQFTRFVRTYQLVSDIVEDVASGLGIQNFAITEDFSHASRFKSNKEMMFVISFSEDPEGAVGSLDKPHKVFRIAYDPGGRFSSEHLRSRFIPFVLPEKKTDHRFLTAREAMELISAENTDHFARVTIDCPNIDQQEIAQLVKVLFATARENKPRTE